MRLIVAHSPNLGGSVRIPPSKSHTIRAIFFAALAEDGVSTIASPLISRDTRAAMAACDAFGAAIEETPGALRIKGVGRALRVPAGTIDTGNSGTAIAFAMGMASLAAGTTRLTGDAQIRRRPLGPLIQALSQLGAAAHALGGDGMPPVEIRGRADGGTCVVDSPISQYASSLLICAPLYDRDTQIVLQNLLEVPYVEVTLAWLRRLGIRCRNESFHRIHIDGGQHYAPFETSIPGDFSSATFFAVLAAISGAEIVMTNLDMGDVQGDKKIFNILERMGAAVHVDRDSVSVKGGTLVGMEIDLGAMPDAICALAVAGCFAKGETKIRHVPQARFKETDRIAVMTRELRKMGADIEETPDGLTVRHSRMHGADLHSSGDHRVVMALALAGLCATGETTISEAEAMSATFPAFPQRIASCGGHIQMV